MPSSAMAGNEMRTQAKIAAPAAAPNVIRMSVHSVGYHDGRKGLDKMALRPPAKIADRPRPNNVSNSVALPWQCGIPTAADGMRSCDCGEARSDCRQNRTLQENWGDDSWRAQRGQPKQAN